MTGVSLRPILAPLVGAAMCFAAMQHPAATERGAVIEQFVARAAAVGVPAREDAGRIDIYIHRWSTEEEWNSLRGSLTASTPGKVVIPLRNMLRPAGVVLLPGVQGLGARVRTRTPKNLVFAREVDTPSGHRLILASDERLGLGEPQRDARKEIEEFTLVDIRFGPDGKGVGKMAGAENVAYSAAAMTLEVKDFARQPVRLFDVKSDKPEKP